MSFDSAANQIELSNLKEEYAGEYNVVVNVMDE